ncbi:MAG: DUF3795 domain-containing protein [Phycisphaerae bacterium]|nr:DUF3795 domain-containing protein [Phycisphaerae bacterium]
MTNDREQTICCGLHCGDCIPSNRPLFDAAERLRAELQKCQLDKYARYKSNGNRAFADFGTFREVLDAILTLPCPKPCFHGGGRPDCPIRACAQEKGMEGCWQCTTFETCTLLEPMAACHGNTVSHNLRTIRQFGVEQWADKRGKHYLWSGAEDPSPEHDNPPVLNPERHRVEFDSIPWESPAPGVRFKKCERQDRRLRLVEFTKEFVETDWCTQGHAGYVLEGAIAVDFHGEDVVFLAGDGLFIPPGNEHGHKARAITDAVRLVLVDE